MNAKQITNVLNIEGVPPPQIRYSPRTHHDVFRFLQFEVAFAMLAKRRGVSHANARARRGAVAGPRF